MQLFVESCLKEYAWQRAWVFWLSFERLCVACGEWLVQLSANPSPIRTHVVQS